MSISRLQVLEIVVSCFWCVMLLLAILYLGRLYVNDGSMSYEGTMGLIGIIAGFIVAMMGTGYWLSKLKN